MVLHTWLLYFAAAIGLSLTPGPNSLLVLTHGALHGQRRTLWTVAGGALGFLALIALSMLGIGALLAASSQALWGLKLLGGVYLVWLGWQVWRAPAIVLDAGAAAAAPTSAAALLRQGLLTALSNPKALLFYGALLPQFIDAAQPLLPQFVAMALTFVAVEVLVEWGLAALAGRIRPWLQRSGRRFNRACGSLFVAMGLALPMTR